MSYNARGLKSAETVWGDEATVTGAGALETTQGTCRSGWDR